MNDQLQAALADILTKTTTAVEAGVDFLQAELPDVIQQLLAWKLAYSVATILVGTVALLLVGWSFRFYKKEWLLDSEGRRHRYKTTIVFDSDGDVHPGIIGLIGAQIFGTVVFFAGLNFTWLQILIAPKIYLIEYAASLAK